MEEILAELETAARRDTTSSKKSGKWKVTQEEIEYVDTRFMHVPAAPPAAAAPVAALGAPPPAAAPGSSEEAVAAAADAAA